MNKSIIFYEFFVNMNRVDEIKKESIFQDSLCDVRLNPTQNSQSAFVGFSAGSGDEML